MKQASSRETQGREGRWEVVGRRGMGLAIHVQGAACVVSRLRVPGAMGVLRLLTDDTPWPPPHLPPWPPYHRENRPPALATRWIHWRRSVPVHLAPCTLPRTARLPETLWFLAPWRSQAPSRTTLRAHLDPLFMDIASSVSADA